MLESVALLFLRAIIALMNHLPDSMAILIARFCVFIIRIAFKRSHQVATRNLELIFPNLSKAEHQKIELESYKILALNLMSFARIPKLSKEQIDSTCDYQEAFLVMQEARAEASAKGVGTIITTAHFGLFEHLVQVGAIVNRPVAILARGFGMNKIDTWWNKRREFFGNEVFFRKGGYKQTITRLKSGQDVAMLCDQNVKANHAVFVDFFGIPAATTKSVAFAAIRTGSPIVFVASIKTGQNKFKIIAKKIPNPELFPGETEEKIISLNMAIHKELEELIKIHPEHWFWIHRRFKTRPKGEPENFYI
jgi:Kdo2-lipid IVA lauroyltransferase/acyltransferase